MQRWQKGDNRENGRRKGWRKEKREMEKITVKGWREKIPAGRILVSRKADRDE